MTWNSGIIRTMIEPMAITRTGTLTSSSSDRVASSRTAMITPPTTVMGAAMSRVHVMSTSICTWVTSLVIRVINDGAPNPATSWAENPVTRWNSSPRTSRPKAMPTFDPT